MLSIKLRVTFRKKDAEKYRVRSFDDIYNYSNARFLTDEAIKRDISDIYYLPDEVFDDYVVDITDNLVHIRPSEWDG